MFRKVSKNAQHNALWIATKKEHHASLKADIPAITDFVFDEGENFESAWLQLKDDHDDFETAATSAVCTLYFNSDRRLRPANRTKNELFIINWAAVTEQGFLHKFFIFVTSNLE
jgi:hypothetical protein